MYEREPRIPLHLGSRATRLADMAEALYWAIDELGPRLPARRDIARHSHVSEATISRRLRDGRTTEAHLTRRLVRARRDTYPSGYYTEGWARWLPESEQDLQDVRVWMTCLALAAHQPEVAEAVREAWEHDLTQLGHHVGTADAGAREIIGALVLGLSIRRLLDPALTHDHALALVERVVAAVHDAT